MVELIHSVHVMVKLVVHCKKEPYDVYIGRGAGSMWGNPFSHEEETLAQFRVTTREEAISRYEEWLLSQPMMIERVKALLKEKVLGCWCDPKPCHGHVLARIANEP